MHVLEKQLGGYRRAVFVRIRNRVLNNTLINLKVVLKVDVDFTTLLIGAEGETPRKSTHFLRAWGFKDVIRPREYERERHRGGSPHRPRKAKLLSLQSTARFNTANLIKRHEQSEYSSRLFPQRSFIIWQRIFYRTG